MLQAGKSRVRLPIRLLDFSSDVILPSALASTQPLKKMSTKNLPEGQRAAGV
jgi:hypothetical protein